MATDPQVLKDAKEAQFTPATPRQKWTLGSLVIVFAGVFVAAWFFMFSEVQAQQEETTRVAWTPPQGVSVAPGPASFFFDEKEHELVTRGAITDARKRELSTLVSKNGVGLAPPNPAGATYWQALDRLTFDSNESAGRLGLLIVVLGGLSGLLGVQLRTAINFVEVTTRKNNLDVARWWPWYWVRLPAGFIFGMMAVLLLRVGLLDAGSSTTDNLSWALIIGLLAGFGAAEFAERLRLLVKTLFGEGPKDGGSRKGQGGAGGSQPAGPGGRTATT